MQKDFQMHITEESLEKLKPEEVLELLRLSAALDRSWSKETAYPTDASNWTRDNPSLGQCAVTSLIIQARLGGQIHKNSKFNHYWNELRSEVEVDFTKDQFKTIEPIPSEGIVTRVSLLEGERAIKARTKERYHLLSNRLKENFNKLKPTLFLLSSNAQAEYIQDIIEAICLPEGSSHHFRYSLGYLDRFLKKAIPLQGQSMPRSLQDANVVVMYLNQARRGPRDYVWNSYLPVRLGTLRNCYKTDDGENSTAHFYFQLGQGLIPFELFQIEFKRVFGDNYQKKYSLLAYCDTDSILSKASPTRIFEDQCKRFNACGFTYVDHEKKTEKKYDPPLMILIEGLYRRRRVFRDKRLSPIYDTSTDKSYYHLKEATPYFVRYRTSCTDISESRQVIFRSPKESFSTPSDYTQNIHALYYSETWDIEPAYVEHGTRGFFELQTLTPRNPNIPPNQLDCKISIPFEIRRKLLLRGLDILIDALFALGPVYLAATKLYENQSPKPWYFADWPKITLAIYSIWFVLKLVRNAIRGK